MLLHFFSREGERGGGKCFLSFVVEVSCQRIGGERLNAECRVVSVSVCHSEVSIAYLHSHQTPFHPGNHKVEFMSRAER